MSAQPSARGWVRDPAVLWRRIGASLLLLVPGAGEALEVSGSAADVWDLLASPTGLDDLVAAAACAYGSEKEMLLDDIARLVEDLADREILVTAP